MAVWALIAVSLALPMAGYAWAAPDAGDEAAMQALNEAYQSALADGLDPVKAMNTVMAAAVLASGGNVAAVVNAGMRLAVRNGLDADQMRQVAQGVLNQQPDEASRQAMQAAINRGLAQGAADKGQGLSGALNLIDQVNGGKNNGQKTGPPEGTESEILEARAKSLINEGLSPEEALNSLLLTMAWAETYGDEIVKLTATLMQVGVRLGVDAKGLKDFAQRLLPPDATTEERQKWQAGVAQGLAQGAADTGQGLGGALNLINQVTGDKDTGQGQDSGKQSGQNDGQLSQQEKDELAGKLADQVREMVGQGMSPEEAMNMLLGVMAGGGPLGGNFGMSQAELAALFMQVGVQAGLTPAQLRQQANDLLEVAAPGKERADLQAAINRGLAKGAAANGQGLSGALDLIDQVSGKTEDGQNQDQNKSQDGGLLTQQEKNELAGKLADQVKEMVAQGMSPEDAMNALLGVMAGGGPLGGNFGMSQAELAALFMQVGVQAGLTPAQLRQQANDLLDVAAPGKERDQLQAAINRGLALGAAANGQGLSSTLALIDQVSGKTEDGQNQGQDQDQGGSLLNEQDRDELAGKLADQVKEMVAEGMSPEAAMTALLGVMAGGGPLGGNFGMSEAELAALFMQVGVQAGLTPEQLKQQAAELLSLVEPGKQRDDLQKALAKGVAKGAKNKGMDTSSIANLVSDVTGLDADDVYTQITDTTTVTTTTTTTTSTTSTTSTTETSTTSTTSTTTTTTIATTSTTTTTLTTPTSTTSTTTNTGPTTTLPGSQMVYSNSGFEVSSNGGFYESPSNKLSRTQATGGVTPTEGTYMGSLAGDGFAALETYYDSPAGYKYMAVDVYLSYTSQVAGDSVMFSIGNVRKSDGKLAAIYISANTANPNPGGVMDIWRTYAFEVGSYYKCQFGNDLPQNTGFTTMYIDNIRWLVDLSGQIHDVVVVSPYQ